MFNIDRYDFDTINYIGKSDTDYLLVFKYIST